MLGGFQFLDVRKESLEISNETQKEMKSLGCEAETFRDLFRPAFGPKCRQLAADTLNALHLDGALYWYTPEDQLLE
jgi:hypothetical protein